LKNSYLTDGITLPRLIRLLGRNKISLHPKYLLRTGFLLQSAFWSSIFAFFENARYRKKIRSVPVPSDIIFIIGHWRTGSTFLHQMMAQDTQFACPTLFQVALPDHFISSYHYFRPVMLVSMSKHRPMDNVKIGMNEPQEDEYAIYRITDYSPLEKIVFPVSDRYFLKDLKDWIPSKDCIGKWEKEVVDFFRKLYFLNRKTIVSKNPFNSMRIPELHSMFPSARFIHIHRHPFDVVPSTIQMWDIVQQQNALNGNGGRPDLEEVADVLEQMLTCIRRDSALLPEGSFHEVCFERLEKDPAGTIKELYGFLGIAFTEGTREKLEGFLKSVSNYRKNNYDLSGTEKDLIRQKLSHHMSRYGYN
jgi:hypothetical protein